MLFCFRSGASSSFQSAYCVATISCTHALDGLEGVGRAHAVRPDVARLARDLLLDARHADLEKLVEIRAHDPEELHPLEQRLRRILRLLEHAAVELQPAQLAVDEIRVIGKIGPRRPVVRQGSSARRYPAARKKAVRAGWHGESGARGSNKRRERLAGANAPAGAWPSRGFIRVDTLTLSPDSSPSFRWRAHAKKTNAKWWELELAEWLAVGLAFCGIVAVFCVFFIRRHVLEYHLEHTFACSDPAFFGSALALADPAPLAGNKIDLLENGDDYFPAMLAAIRGAEKTVNFEAYIVYSDASGRAFRDALCERARAGKRSARAPRWRRLRLEAG